MAKTQVVDEDQGREPEEFVEGPSAEQEAEWAEKDAAAGEPEVQETEPHDAPPAVAESPKTALAMFKEKTRDPQFIEAVEQNLGSMSKLDPQQVARVAYQAYASNPMLQQCTIPSIIMCVMEASALGLTISGTQGHCYLVPYTNKKTGRKEAQFILGYKGEIELARRGGVTDIYAECVYENDEYKVTKGLHRDIIHVPAEGDRGALKAVYAVAYTKDSSRPVFVDLTKEEVMKRKAASKDSSGKYSPWVNWEPSMWEKSGIHKLSKYLSLGVAEREAFGRDEARDQGRMQGHQVITDAIDVQAAEVDPLDRIAGA